MNHTAKDYFSEEDINRILGAIKLAEHETSGEIRVHVEKHCPVKDVLDRTAQLFGELNMHKTSQRNGVLIYIAFEHRKFAIIGDAGINKVVEKDFWDSIRDKMSESFKQSQFTSGLISGIEMVGEKLKKYFPYQKDDKNELPDEISTD